MLIAIIIPATRLTKQVDRYVSNGAENILGACLWNSIYKSIKPNGFVYRIPIFDIPSVSGADVFFISSVMAVVFAIKNPMHATIPPIIKLYTHENPF